MAFGGLVLHNKRGSASLHKKIDGSTVAKKQRSLYKKETAHLLQKMTHRNL